MFWLRNKKKIQLHTFICGLFMFTTVCYMLANHYKFCSSILNDHAINRAHSAISNCSSINDHAINNSYSRYLVGKTQVFIIPTLVSCN